MSTFKNTFANIINPISARYASFKENRQLHEEVKGFEPLIRINVCWFSRPVPSTTQPHFRTQK